MYSALASSVGSGVTGGLNYSLMNNGQNYTGFSKANINDIKAIGSTIGGTTASVLEYVLTGETTMNIFNASDINGNLSGGLFSITVSKNGVKTNISSAGNQLSMLGLKRGKENIALNNRIEEFTSSNNLDIATALRSQHGYGDKEAKQQLTDILDGNATLDLRTDPYDTDITSKQNGIKNIVVYGYTDNMTVEEQLAFGLKLQNEAHMSGNYTEGAAQKMEARSATMAHTEMAVKMRDDGQNFSISTVLAYQMGLYDEGLLDDVIDAGYALQKQDGSFDKGRALTYEERYWVGEAFGNMGFPLLDYASVNNVVPSKDNLRAVEGSVSETLAADMYDIYQSQNNPNYSGFGNTVQNQLGQDISGVTPFSSETINGLELMNNAGVLNDKDIFITNFISGNPDTPVDPANLPANYQSQLTLEDAIGYNGESLPNGQIYYNANSRSTGAIGLLTIFLHEYNHQIQYMIADTDLFGSTATGNGKTLFDAAGITQTQINQIKQLSYAGAGKTAVFSELFYEATWDPQDQYDYDLTTNPTSFADFATLESQCQLWEDLLN